MPKSEKDILKRDGVTEGTTLFITHEISDLSICEYDKYFQHEFKTMFSETQGPLSTIIKTIQFPRIRN